MELSESLFNLLHNIRHNLLEEVKLLDVNLSPMHLKSLKIISKIDECTGQKLSSFMGRDKAQVNRLIKELVGQELITKNENLNDKRSQILTLTPAGIHIMKQFKIAEQQVFTKLVNNVEPEKIEEFIKLADQFNSNLGK